MTYSDAKIRLSGLWVFVRRQGFEVLRFWVGLGWF